MVQVIMRYTTIIDITELPEVYRNPAARLLYLHLVLRSGYHDDDRDTIGTSIRRISSDTGISVSATRHALRLLEAAGLVSRKGPRWQVVKWVMTKEITARPKQGARSRAAEAAVERERQQRALELTYRKKSQEEHDRELVATYERFLAAERDGTISVAGRGFLSRSKAQYEQIKNQTKV